MAQNYVLLERIELNASTASVTFSNIPQSGYTDLKVVMSSRSTNANVTDDVYLTVNGLNTSIYSVKAIQGSGSAATSFSNSGTSLPNTISDGANATANTFGSVEFYIPNYTSSNYKSVSIDSVQEDNTTAAYMRLLAGLISTTSTISSVTLTSTGLFVQYSTFSLYGLAALGTTPVIAPKASGGNITTDGTYWIHTFNATGAFVPSQTLSCDYLVVAGGGGGGGAYYSGGGGAGGFRTATAQSLSATSYTVTVGAGGAGGPSPVSSNYAPNGTNSSINSFSATGGGGGGQSYTTFPPGASGGSGGGGSTAAGRAGVGGSGNAGSYSPVEGYAGGTGAGIPSVVDNSGGGGGGAGGVGGNANGSTAGGAGGSGASNSYSGSAVTYAGGGGGGGGASAAGGAAGSGGGGTGGGVSSSPTAGTVNTGGGGGGQGNNQSGGIGGAGGSGIVIIRYAMA